MTVREVVLDRDMRAPFHLPARFILQRYYARRAVSVATLALLDLVAVTVAVVAGPLVWGEWLGLQVYTPGADALLAAAFISGLCAASCGLYGVLRRRHSAPAVLQGAFATLLVLALLVVLLDYPMLGPSLFLYWLLGTVAALVLRRLYDLAVVAWIGEDADAERLVVVGGAAEGSALCAALSASEQGRRYVLAGALSGDDLPSLAVRCDELRPTQIVVADMEAARAGMSLLLDACRRLRVPLKVSVAGLVDDESVAFLPGFDVPLFTVSVADGRRRHFMAKRAADFAGAAAGLVLLSPVFLAIALAVKLTSRGPVLYASRRVGVGQRVFPCYKFRTMCVDAENRQADLEHLNKMDGCLFKIAEDPRVTPVGGFLRRHSLDELPQLINVLRGEMSLVGPRPLPVRDVALMSDGERRRHVVLPGMTGLWQVSGRADLGFDDMMALDQKYIETWSLRGDLAILAYTVAVVFTRNGAY